ncbi:MAG: EscN/YscN/HrcN family type III secretion system ATPase, partial [Hafniaceae bacterium]|nr:EscN/YscN/HrcN family type III secretion system ATPase [Hafniaceae bacterium]
ITAFYTVLVEGDDMNEPLADEVRSLLDGHIVLSRRLAESAHFPAIDVLASLSRIMPMVTSAEHRELANTLRRRLSVYREVELLVRVGEFTRGEDPQADCAVESYPAICHFLQQQGNELCNLDELLQQLRYLTGN